MTFSGTQIPITWRFSIDPYPLITGVAAGPYTEPHAHQKPSGTVTSGILGLLLPTNQGKHLPRFDYKVPILVGLASIAAGGRGGEGQPNACLLTAWGYS